MNSPVETITPEESVRTAATRLANREISSLVVCEDSKPVGIITDIDITQVVADGADPETTDVSSAMSSPLVTIIEDKSVEEAAEKLREHQVKRLPVVDADDAMVGIVTTTDLSSYIPHLASLKREQAPTGEHARQNVRPDTAYENDDWEFEYFGDERKIDVGDTITFSKSLTEENIRSFAEASGDTNRLHLDEEYAAKTRFGGRIAHGTLVTSTISAALARLPGLTIYLSQDVSFLAPVSIGDRITAECSVVERIGERRFRLTTRVFDSEGETVIDGEAAVISDTIPD